MMRFKNIFLIILATLSEVFSSKILFLFPTPTKSHMIVAHALSTTFAERGHEVTVLSPFILSKKIPNHREILVPFNDEIFKKFTQESFQDPVKSLLKSFPWLINLCVDIGMNGINLPEFQKITKNEKFDLIVIGMFFNNFLLGYGDHFKCPTVMLSVMGSSFFSNPLVGNAFESNAVPIINPKNSRKMIFIERVKNFLMVGVEHLMVGYMNYRMKSVYE